ncbi:MAG: peptide chain release factor 1 [Myxococcales bacterium]|nr:peptide chain release factor 1 [Myxococcales bacterium]
MADLLDKIAVFEGRAAQLEAKLADPAVASSPSEYAEIAKELARVRPAAETSIRYRRLLTDLGEARHMRSDPDAEVRELAEAEVAELEAQREALEGEVRTLLVPGDPNDEKNVILEIRAGTGGDEAALFADDLFRMYCRYAEKQGWKVEELSRSATDGGGVKEVIAIISGDRIFSRLKFERGVHRVQRVPATESQGRIHTSTVTVAVLPEAEEVDIRIDPKDLRVDVYRASGPGGQSVNTTDSAVRITHIPTDTVVQCQDEKSQHKNKARAMKILRSRVLEREVERRADERSSERRAQVGTGERSEKIRTYNFPQSRVTDHRAGVTLHRLEAIVGGDLDEILDSVHGQMAAKAMAAGELA